MKIRLIEDRTRIATAGIADEMILPEETPPFIFTLISQKAATLREIRDCYTFEEAIDLYEIVLVSAYNQVQAADAARRKSKLGG